MSLIDIIMIEKINVAINIVIIMESIGIVDNSCNALKTALYVGIE